MKKKFFNPFEIFSEKKLLVVGILSAFILVLMSVYFHTRFLGILNIDFLNSISPKKVLFEQLMSVFISTILFYALGKYLNSKTRFIDVLNAVLISRIPFLIVPVLNVNNHFSEVSKRYLGMFLTTNPTKPLDGDLIFLMLCAIPILTAFVLFFVLLFNGFKTATNAKGNKAILFFAITVILLDISIKLLFKLLN